MINLMITISVFIHIPNIDYHPNHLTIITVMVTIIHTLTAKFKNMMSYMISANLKI